MATRDVTRIVNQALRNNILSVKEAREVVKSATHSIRTGNETPVSIGEMSEIGKLYQRIVGPTTMDAPAIRATQTAIDILVRFLENNGGDAYLDLGDYVTMAVDEDGGSGDTATTAAIGEEDGGDTDYVTMAVDEDGGSGDTATTAAVGEEDGGDGDYVTMAIDEG